ncbi:MAG: PAS domain S-box protein [Methanoregula sp.]|nr:PAS domain S-box protein [Methanoregula sp.]
MTDKIRILYVDDEETLLELCKMFLERSGNFTVTVTTSAPEAIRILGQERYDAIVSDYQMPEMDGIEFLKHLKAKGNTTPFIIFTGKGREEVVIDALNAGADGYLQKGGEPKSQFIELSHKIKKAVEGRQAEKAFKGSEERYRNLFHKILNGFAVHEILCDDAGKPCDYRFLDINPAFEKMTGLTRESVIGKTVLEVLPKTEPTWIERYGKVALTGEPDYFVEHSGELDKIFEVTVYQNAPRQFTTIFSDITERKRAEEALVESDKFLNSIIENIPNMIFVKEAQELRFVRFNKAGEDLLGYSREDLYGKNDYDLFLKDEADSFTAHDREVLLNKHLLDIPDERIHTRDKGTRILHTKKLPILDNEGNPRFLIGISEDITERTQADAALMESELRYRNLFDNMLEGFAHCRMLYDESRRPTDFIYLNVNPAFNRISGTSVVVGKPVTEVFPGIKEAFPELFEIYGRVALTGEPESFDLDFVPSQKWLHISVYSLEKEHFVAIFEDITERKRAEVALRESEHEFRSLAEAMPQIVWVTRADGWNIYFNQQWVDYTGLSLEESHGHGWNTPFHPDDRQRAWDAWQRATQHQDTYSLECRLRRADGVYQWWLIRGVPLRNASGEIFKWFGTCTNIEDLKQADERFRHAFEDTNIGMAIMAPDGHLMQVNRALCELLGYTKTELVGKNFHDVSHPDDIILKGDGLLEMLSAPQDVINFEKRYLRKNGDVVWGAVNSILIHDSEGLPLYFITHLQDITRQKTDAEKIGIANRKLELMNDVTYQDIQNKVTALRGYADLSRDARTETERSAYIRKEERILADIHQLIKNTKQYQEMGLKQPQWIPVEDEIRIAAALTSSETAVAIDADLHGLELYTDPLIGKIFFHLIDNAMKHGAGLTRITFSFREIPEGLVLVCEDDGAGIDPHKRATLFSRITGDPPRFGLFFVRESLLLSGMTIAETSEPGKGARFEITVSKGLWRMKDVNL